MSRDARAGIARVGRGVALDDLDDRQRAVVAFMEKQKAGKVDRVRVGRGGHVQRAFGVAAGRGVEDHVDLKEGAAIEDQ
jgi:hypothetical protein